jgi:hypothetical protein
MKLVSIALAAALALGFAGTGFANPSLSLKHKNVTCETCHATKTPTKMADQKACIQCHGQYKGKVVPNADYNPDRNPRRPVIEVNPHDSHLGDVRCTLCHKEHGQSLKTTCNQCHENFRLNAK